MELRELVDFLYPKVVPFIVGIGAIISYRVGSFIYEELKERKRLNKILSKKQVQRTEELVRLRQKFKLHEKNKRIVDLSWDDLVQGLQSRELKAVQVLEAYTAKALDATLKFNSITDFIPQAAEWAQELDKLPSPKGPLHGIPFCVKDDLDVQGMDTTMGYAKLVYKPAKETAVFVKGLMDLGAIPFCKTNVPQTMATYGSDNPVYGYTLNACNPKLSPGGSSSGTGSLVGAHGCFFGTGSDIGGSIRIPSSFNGIAGIKPTIGRTSSKGEASPIPNLMGISAVQGVLGRTPSIVTTVFKEIVDDKRQHKLDPQVAPIPWDEEMFKSKKNLRIGYFTSLPFFPSMGDQAEVLLRAKSKLEELGHTLVPFNMPDGYKYMKTITKFLMADESRKLMENWKGERIPKSVYLIYFGSWLPMRIQNVLAKLMRSGLLPFMSSKRTSEVFGAGALKSQQLWDANGEKLQVIEEIHKEWRRLNLNAVISPLFPFPAPPKDLPGMLPEAVVYSMIWNLADFPAGVLPFGKESGKRIADYNDEGDTPLKMAKKGIKESIGAPIGVQIVGLPFEEENVLRLMCELEPFSLKQ